jgi:flagellar hook-length control protein FliK
MVSIVTLREESVPTQINAVDTGQALNVNTRGGGRGGSGSPFEAIMAQLTQAPQTLGRTVAGQSSQAASTSINASDTTTTDSQSTPGTPIKNLEQSLRSTGQPLESFQVSSANRAKLEKVLSQSGYRDEDVRQLLDRSTGSDGSINLGVLFANLAQYQPTQGPMLLLNPEDAPLLTQVLKGLGLDQDKIQQYMDNLPRRGDKLVVQGLPELLAQADPQQGKAVDQGVLGDLLGRLGLGQSDVQSLLAKATDNQGRTTAPAVLAMVGVAAQRQDQGLGQSLKDLAASLQLVRNGSGKAGDANHLRAKVIQTLQKIEAQVSAQTQSLSQHWQEAFEQAQAALKGLGGGQTQGLAQGQGNGLALSQGNGQALGQGMGLALGQGMGLPEMLRQALGEQAGASALNPQALHTDSATLVGKLVEQSLASAQQVAASETPGGTPSARSEGIAASGQEALKAGQPDATQGLTNRPVDRSQAGSGVGIWGQNAAQAEESAPAGPALPAYVVRQVAPQIVQMVSRQETSLRLDLKPPSLGEVNLELSVKDGVVKATMVTDTVAAKQALESGLDQLKQQLTLQGLKVDSVEITVNPDAQRQEAQAQAGFERRRQGSSERGVSGGTGAIEGMDSLDASLAAANAGFGNARINLFA